MAPTGRWSPWSPGLPRTCIGVASCSSTRSRPWPRSSIPTSCGCWISSWRTRPVIWSCPMSADAIGAYIQERRGGMSTTFPVLDVFVPVPRRAGPDASPGDAASRRGTRQHPSARGRRAAGAWGRSAPKSSRQPALVGVAAATPLEQYSRWPGWCWTDVYAVGASIRTCMEGRTPPPSVERQKKDTLIPATVELKRRSMFLLEAVEFGHVHGCHQGIPRMGRAPGRAEQRDGRSAARGSRAGATGPAGRPTPGHWTRPPLTPVGRLASRPVRGAMQSIAQRPFLPRWGSSRSLPP